MKKLFPVLLVLVLIPIAFACKKGTNSTGTVTNGVARVELTFSPAIPTIECFGVDIMVKNPNPNTTSSLMICGLTSQYISDDYAVTEGQNFTCYYKYYGSSIVTSKIYYNNVLVSSKSFSFTGGAKEHNAICK